MSQETNTNKPKKINKPIRPVREISGKAQNSASEQKNTAAAAPVKNAAEVKAAEKNELQKNELPGIKRESITNSPAVKAPEKSDTQTCDIVKKQKFNDGGNKNRRKANKKENSVWSSVIKALIYMLAVFLVAGAIGYHIITIGNDIFAFVKSTDVVEVTIPEGVTLNDVARIFDENDIVKYPGVFKLYAKYKKYTDIFEPGTYQVSPSMNYDNLLLSLRHRADYTTVRVTIPEGYTVDEIIDLLVSNGISSKEAFVDVINNYDFDFEFVKALDGNTSPDRFYRLEGYLFPDTYEFYQNSTPERVIYKMLANFQNKYSDQFEARAAELGFTKDQVIILASMIEKETKYPNEFEYVSSVFHNRLNNPANYPYLDSDATIVYAIQHNTGERPKELTSTDYESPYNTYKNRGLPPGPIANPGYAAIMCALYPEKTNYYYFVAAENGSSIFSRTLSEHQAAIWKLRNSKQ